MAGTIQYFDSTIQANLKIASEIMYKEMGQDLFWIRWITFMSRKAVEKGVEEVGFVGEMLNEKEVQPPKSAIGVYEQFGRKEKGTEMFIPTRLHIKGKPIYGDRQLIGTGERNNFVYHNIHINQVRKAIAAVPGRMVEQSIGRYVDEVINQTQPQLTDWLRKYVNTSMIRRALIEGRSHNLTASTQDFGLGLRRVSPSNFYVVGHVAADNTAWVGGLDYAAGRPGSDAYESLVETALNSLGVGDSFTVALLKKLSVIVRRQKNLLPPIQLSDKSEWFPMVITPYQYSQLLDDPAWEKIVLQILPREGNPKDNWMLNGAVGYAHGFILYVDNGAFGAHTNANKYGHSSVTAGFPEYGCEDDPNSDDFADIADLDESYLSVGLILGRNACSVGIAKKPGYTMETFDHDAQSEGGIYWIAGAERWDMYDTDGQVAGLTAGDFYKNESMVAFATYSPSVV